MRTALCRVALAAALVSVLPTLAQAQQTSSSSETKSFEILAVDGNKVVVRLPEGTKELIVADDFRFTVNGQPLAVGQLKPGMKGTATITTQTTVTPVTVTEVKNGTVYERFGGSIIVQTPEGLKSFSEAELDKRGVKIVKNGKPAALDDLNKGDKLTATIVTSAPPRVVSRREVQATVPTASATPPTAPPAAAPRPTPPAAAATTPAEPTAAPTTSTPKKLPKTASSWPLLVVFAALSMATGLALTIRRRRVANVNS